MEGTGLVIENHSPARPPAHAATERVIVSGFG
jgi:hypothetical protein